MSFPWNIKKESLFLVYNSISSRLLVEWSLTNNYQNKETNTIFLHIQTYDFGGYYYNSEVYCHNTAVFTMFQKFSV